ncbi:hypothetical protein PZA11_008061 [Diplocarpon coronariae]
MADLAPPIYFTCTLGEAAEINRRTCSKTQTVNQLIEDLAAQYPRAPAVAFPIPSADCKNWGPFKDLHQGSPQCSPEAISALCKSCKASMLYHDLAHSGLASAASKSASFLKPALLYWQAEASSISEIVKNTDRNPTLYQRPDALAGDVAFIHHSSGTSTGIPKPIPQTHHGAVGVLPALDGQDAATLTTTPLYHGGLISRCPVYKCGADSPVRYFSSVPYVLQMLADTSEGLSALERMDIVGVEALRFLDSAECGFLLSSHRDYPSDKAWQYLRVPSSSPHLKFEHQSDGSGLSELVVLSTWPHMAKRNREDGSYATSDLFQRHPSIENAWRYDSRSDSQITLLTGKKFDPAPREDAIRSSSSVIDDILIFGNDRQFPGAIVFPAQDHGMSEQALRQEIWAVVSQTNSVGQAHSAISRSMCVVLTGRHDPLDKSSKGTLLRSKAEKTYAAEIEDAYRVGEDDIQVTTKTNASSAEDESIVSMVRRTVTENTGAFMEDDVDFYQFGVDSARAIQIRSVLQQRIRSSLPWNVVYDCDNIEGLARFISELQGGSAGNRQQQGDDMEELVREYSIFQIPTETPSQERDVSGYFSVVLTGATGGLGAHILDILRDNPAVSRVICLVRAKDDATACERVSSSLTRRRKQPLSSQDAEQRVWCIPVHFDAVDLGIQKGVTEEIRATASHFIHAINFSLPLKSFVREHIAGLHNLINFASSCPRFAQFVFCSSTASVLGHAGATGPLPIPEKISRHQPPGDALGYSKSKWVAEAICANASNDRRLAGRVKILRIGQLTGDTANGVWNRSEAWPLMISSSMKLGCLPLLDERLSWLPVDIAARAVVDISLAGRTTEDLSVYHLVNNSTDTTWSDLFTWLNHAAGARLKLVSPDEWLDKLERADGDPARSLLGLWRSSYGSSSSTMRTIADAEKGTAVTFDISNALRGSRAMHDIAPLDEVLVGKIWRWLDGSDE